MRFKIREAAFHGCFELILLYIINKNWCNICRGDEQRTARRIFLRELHSSVI